MNRFGDIDCSFKRLPPVYGYRSEKLVSIEKALEPIQEHIDELPYYIKIAKKNCHYPSEHGLSKDQSAAVYIYTMEWGETTLYRVLNKALRSEDRQALKIWFPYLKLFDSGLKKLPTVKEAVWRGVPLDIGKHFTKNKIVTWWSVNSCSSSANVIKKFIEKGKKSTLFLIEAINGKRISGYTEFEDEDEVILPLGSQFTVNGDVLEQFNGSYLVYLNEIDDDGDDDDEENVTPAMNEMQVAAKPSNKGTSDIKIDGKADPIVDVPPAQISHEMQAPMTKKPRKTEHIITEPKTSTLQKNVNKVDTASNDATGLFSKIGSWFSTKKASLQRLIICLVAIFFATIIFQADFALSNSQQKGNITVDKSSPVKIEELSEAESSAFYRIRRAPSLLHGIPTGIIKPSGGPWGEYKEWVFCPGHTWAIGFTQRVEPYCGGCDDTSMNSLQLICGDTHGVAMAKITSYLGIWGDWSDPTYCYGTGNFLTGVQFKIEPEQGHGDDTSINDSRFTCTKGNVIQASNGEQWGHWSTYAHCPPSSAICGFQIRFEPEQGNGDDSAMNGANFLCCSI